jgi:prepilin-type N-terminal cleavage/methylation domain-containing protein
MIMGRANNHRSTINGFTIVELIVVVVVIGILVIVGTFSFNNWRRMTAQREVTSDLNGVVAAMDSARNWNNGYPVYTASSAFPSSVFAQSPNVQLTYKSGDATTYCVNAVSKVIGTVQYYINAAGGNKTPAAGQCP